MQQKRYVYIRSDSPSYGSTPPGGLIGRILAFIVGVGALLLSLFVGAVFIAAIVGFMLIVGLIVAARVWWMRRQADRYQREHGDLDAEYTVVNPDDDRRP